MEDKDPHDDKSRQPPAAGKPHRSFVLGKRLGNYKGRQAGIKETKPRAPRQNDFMADFMKSMSDGFATVNANINAQATAIANLATNERVDKVEAKVDGALNDIAILQRQREEDKKANDERHDNLISRLSHLELAKRSETEVSGSVLVEDVRMKDFASEDEDEVVPPKKDDEPEEEEKEPVIEGDFDKLFDAVFSSFLGDCALERMAYLLELERTAMVIPSLDACHVAWGQEEEETYHAECMIKRYGYKWVVNPQAAYDASPSISLEDTFVTLQTFVSLEDEEILKG